MGNVLMWRWQEKRSPKPSPHHGWRSRSASGDDQMLIRKYLVRKRIICRFASILCICKFLKRLLFLRGKLPTIQWICKYFVHLQVFCASASFSQKINKFLNFHSRHDPKFLHVAEELLVLLLVFKKSPNLPPKPYNG
jgi:hypothetical protein